jgi:serine protease AprX
MNTGDLDGTSSQIDRKNWLATAVILVVDQEGNPLADASVSGAWSGGYTGSAACTTAADGTCSLATNAISVKNATATFSVSDVTHTSFAYEPASNTDPDGDSDGTVITVNQP